MEPLFDRLSKQKFTNSEEAIEYCHKTCLEHGFTVNHEAGANRVSYHPSWKHTHTNDIQ